MVDSSNLVFACAECGDTHDEPAAIAGGFRCGCGGVLIASRDEVLPGVLAENAALRAENERLKGVLNHSLGLPHFSIGADVALAVVEAHEDMAGLREDMADQDDVVDLLEYHLRQVTGVLAGLVEDGRLVGSEVCRTLTMAQDFLKPFDTVEVVYSDPTLLDGLMGLVQEGELS